MILRSVMKHVREQNWLAVGIDFVIVVVGVFIGIQVANWNDALADRRLGMDYEQRLAMDLEDDLLMLRTQLEYFIQVRASILRAEALLQQADSDPFELVQHAYRATEINDSVSNRTSWDQVVSSGHIGLISQEASSFIMEYFTFQAVRRDLDSLVTSDYRKRVRGLLPASVQHAIRAGCSDVSTETAFITGFVPECRINVPAALLADAAERLRADSEVRETLGYQYSEVSAFIGNTQGSIVLVESALAALAD